MKPETIRSIVRALPAGYIVCLMLDMGYTQVEIAKRFGSYQSRISSLKTAYTYKHGPVEKLDRESIEPLVNLWLEIHEGDN